ncbi:MAG: VWA domain-containing protein [Candidatus Cloacimonetes bacterium]|nr:VWA domain-containing protein [Candidatus Cloacimonadota bacterium]
MRILKVALLLLILAYLGSCSESGANDLEFYLYGNYTNIDGSNPDFEIATNLTDGEIFFDGIVEYGGTPPTVELIMNNLSIFSQQENYYIDDIEVEEQVNGEWVWYPEFEVEFGNLTQLGVILVLDVSSSLGNDFDDVLEYAVEFVEIVIENAPEARIGVVSFATNIDVLTPTNNIYEVESYIYGLVMEDYTRMYDAMAIGIDNLTALEVDGRALVTFTDGWDNLSVTTPVELVSDLTEFGIRSYTMGLKGEGGVNEAVLEELSVNGNYRLTSSKNDLRKIFQFFAESVSNVYQVIYRRNSQIITNPRQIRYKFIDEL